MMLRRYAELTNVARGKETTNVVVAMSSARPGPIFDLLGARLWIVPGERQEPPGWRTFGQLPSAFVYENPKALPRAFLVGRSVVPRTDSERLKLMSDPSFDGGSVAVLEGPEQPWSAGPDFAAGRVELADTKPGFYSLRSDCATESILVLSEAFYPGWTAQVDGVPAPILRADHLLQAVRLTKGRHEVTFSYRSRYLGLGFGIALLALLPPLGLAWIEARKRRAKI
jgi:hypothetical protein